MLNIPLLTMSGTFGESGRWCDLSNQQHIGWGEALPAEVLKCNPARAGSTDSLDLRRYATDAKHRARLSG